MEVVRHHFRPEFINRIDETVVFHALGAEHIHGIAKIQLARLMARLQEQGISLSLEDSVYAQLLEIGYDPVYGARPLKRAIQQTIENPLAQSLLSGEFANASKVTATMRDGTLVFDAT